MEIWVFVRLKKRQMQGAEWLKGKQRRRKMVYGLGDNFLCYVIRVRLTVVFIVLLLIDSVRFTGFSFKTETEPNWQDFMVLKISLIGFSSRFGFLG